MRYSNSKIIVNIHENYEQYFRDRNVSLINTLENSKIKYPTETQLQTIHLEPYIWKDTDRFYKISYQFYKSPKYWWIIPFMNKKALESDFRAGDVVYIPMPLEKFIQIIGLR